LLFCFQSVVFAETLDKVVAVVNSEPVTQNELSQQMQIAKNQLLAAKMAVPNDSALRKKVLDKLIDMKLQLQLAKKANITVTDKQVDQTIAQIASKNHLSVDQLKTAIEQHNMSFADYKNQIRNEMLLSQVTQSQVIPTIKISDTEADQVKAQLIKRGVKGDLDKKARLILLQKKFPSAMKTWLEQLRSQAYVKIINP
jgi:peptidyl-prolyl cis-trans isomerase SurA